MISLYCIIEDIVKYFLETFFIISLKLLYNFMSVNESLKVGKIRGKKECTTSRILLKR